MGVNGKRFMRRRNRMVYIVLLVIVILLGLGSRRFSNYLPMFIAKYSGDTLWALMVFIGMGFIFSTSTTKHVGVVSLIFCFIIEFSQLYHAGWIDGIRATPLGGLILGYGFLWSDLVCYFVGIMIGILMEKYLLYAK